MIDLAEVDYLEMWVIYDHPSDYPTKYVARRWRVAAAGSTPTDGIRVADALDDLRAQMLVEGLARMDPTPGDDATIVETWL